MLNLEFTKMSGCGNDFIICDNRKGDISESGKPDLVRSLCRRRRSLGADGMIFVELSLQADVRMDFFNSDGSRGEMCGNGLRCFARFVAESGITPRMMQVETDAGMYVAEVASGSLVRLAMPPVELPKRNISLGELPSLDFLVVGVPHAVVFDQKSWDWSDSWLHELGERIRQHSYFPNGTNVNFVSITDEGALQVRTFERGVEAETLACGTGVTASALVSSIAHPELCNPITVHTKGGVLQVGFQRSRDRFIDVWLQGNALVIAKGTICPDAI